MEEELISKKELLDMTGISYGQLYRWKRKGIIPEEWFIRKSAFTGQETFFPKQLMLARIDKILHMKDGLSLDDLAEMFSPTPSGQSIRVLDILERNIVSRPSIELAAPYVGQTELYNFEQTLYLYILDQSLLSGEMSLEEGPHLLRTLMEHYGKYEGKNCDLLMIRKMGLSVFMMLSAGSEVFFDGGTKMVFRVSVAKCIEELKLKISIL
ncbi:YhbD family protein [Paenibacillus gorillae]|uniref:YhbD family protein n=1 Tax=Paenibacillus gorillae TaxID=1243662 RepID=UPI0004B24F90|nr:YhbD family protein [Paenibacillus gorillae]